MATNRDPERVKPIPPSRLDQRIQQLIIRLGKYLPGELHGTVYEIILPELHAGSSKPALRIQGKPGTNLRREEMADRVERRESILASGDAGVEDDEAVMCDSPVVVDEYGHKRPAGNAAKAIRCVDDVPVNATYSKVRGEERVALPELSDQRWRGIGDKKEQEDIPKPITTRDVTAVKKNFGTRLIDLREVEDISQGELARRAGLTAAAVSYIESGDRMPGVVTLIRLAHALRVSVNELIGPMARP